MQAVSRRPHPSAGWTLIELMVVFVVMALLLGVGVPSFASMLREYRLTSFSNELHAAMWLTRSEAIRRGHRVTLCTSADGLQCADGVGWNTGWIVFPDPNSNAQRDPAEEVMRTRSTPFPVIVGVGNIPLKHYLSYISTGASRTVGGALQMGTIRLCNGEKQRRIIVSSTGRVRVERDESCD